MAKIKSLINTFVASLLAFSIIGGTILYNQNKKLSESLEMAQNNIEAYLGIVNDSQLANNVLMLNVKQLLNTNDSLLQKVDSVRNELKIKEKQLQVAATLKLVINVNISKGVGGDLTNILKDTTYTDSVKYNDLTTIHYTIGKDTVSIGLDLLNTQYLFVYNKREYKNKKSFIKRLLTLDFKKVNKYKYVIENTNDLIKTDDVRIIEITK